MKMILALIIGICAAMSAYAQPRKGVNNELSLSGSYQNYSSGSSSHSSGAFLLSPRFGFFVVEGFEVEPEVLLLLSSGGDPVYVLNGNVAYNFISSGKQVPFLLVGYGLANTVPIFNVPFAQTGFTVGVINVGAGLKVFLKEDIAIRVEYRYQNFSGRGRTYNFGYASYTEELNATIHTVQFGFTVLL